MKHLKLFEYFEKRNEEEESKRDLLYFSFDIDDNLLHMPTRIHMEHLVDGEWVVEPVDTDKFAIVRKDKENWRYGPGDESFVEFRDWGPRGKDTFMHDFKKAVYDGKFGPSWKKFIECLVNGNIFSIITSRGHSPINVRRAIEWLIYEYGLNKFKKLNIKNVDNQEDFEEQMTNNLLEYHELFGTDPDYVIDQYLDLCPIYTISSPEFKERFPGLSAEESKKVALRDFNKIVHEYANILGVTAKLGFSDDDPAFVKAAADEFSKLRDDFKNVDYSVFDTGGRQMKKFM